MAEDELWEHAAGSLQELVPLLLEDFGWGLGIEEKPVHLVHFLLGDIVLATDASQNAARGEKLHCVPEDNQYHTSGVIPYMRHGCGAEAAAVTANIENIEMWMILFVQCGSRMACGSIAGFFPLHGVIHAAAAHPLQRKVVVVSITAFFSLPTLDLRQQLLKFPRCWQLWWRTTTKNWIRVAIPVWGADRHPVQAFVLLYCVPKSGAFS